MPKNKFFHVDRQGTGTNNDFQKAKLGILSEDVMAYYRNVSTSLEQGFEEEDMKEEFLSNVYKTLCDEGVLVSQNQTVSRILEVLFSHSPPRLMIDLFRVFCSELTVVVFDRFASHVFQALVQYLPAMYEQRGKEDEEGGDLVWKKSFKDSVQALCSFMVNHVRDVMTHTYGSHVLRSFMESLGGVSVRQDVIRSRGSRGQARDTEHQKEKVMSPSLSSDHLSSFKEITEKLVRLCNFEDHLCDQNMSPLLQTVMLILHKIDRPQFEDLVDTIVKKCSLYHHNEDAADDDVTSKLPDLVQSDVGSYLVELILSLASPQRLQDLYANLFKRRIIYFAVHPIANYVLQKMLASVSEPGMMEELLTDVSPFLEDILAVNHIGLVTKLAEACRRTGTGQETLLKTLMAAFHCLKPEERQKKVAPLLASLQTYEVFFGTDDDKSEEGEKKRGLLSTCNLHGSLLLQELLRFPRTALVSASILELSAPELTALCCDRCGSHVVDVFFNSPTVLEKFKVSVLKKLQGSYINIACTRNGSRCLESVWKTCALKQKIHMADDLVKHQERLEGDQFGRFLYRNFSLWQFAQRRKEWMDTQVAGTRKHKLINDILTGATGKNKTKKRKEAKEKSSNPMCASEETSALEQATEVKGSKQSKKRSQEEVVTGSNQSKKQKLKEKEVKSSKQLKEENQTQAHEEEDVGSESNKKKRKRKKEKKRVARGEGVVEASSLAQEDGDIEADSSTANKNGKKKKRRKDRQEGNV